MKYVHLYMVKMKYYNKTTRTHRLIGGRNGAAEWNNEDLSL